MSVFYLDSSVAVRALLNHSPSAAEWFDATTADPGASIISSRILKTEITRVLHREGLPVSRREEILDYVAVVPLTDGILAQAEAILTHIRTLDAIHLASAIACGLELTVVTHDATMTRAATLLGYPTTDPVTT